MFHLLAPGSTGSVTPPTSSGQSARSMTESESQLPFKQQFGQLLDSSTEQRTREPSVMRPHAEAKPTASGARSDSLLNPAMGGEASVTNSADDVASHESWLTLLEGMQGSDEDDSLLTQLADERGLTGDELKAALREALSQLDSSAPASHGKELPDRFDLSTTAATLGQLVQQNDELVLDPRLSRLLQSIGELPDSQQTKVQTQLALLIDDMSEPSASEQNESRVTALQQLVQDYRQLQQHYSDEELAAAMQHLPLDELKIVAALDSESQTWGLLAQNAEQRAEQNTELRTEQGADRRSAHNTEQNAEQRAEQSTEQSTEQRAAQITDQNTELHQENWQALLAKLSEAAQTEQSNTEAEQNPQKYELGYVNGELDASTDADEVSALASGESAKGEILSTTEALSEPELMQALQQLRTALTAQPPSSSQQPVDTKVDTTADTPANAKANTKTDTKADTEAEAKTSELASAAASLRNALETESVTSRIAEIRQLLERHETAPRSGLNTTQSHPQLPPAAQALSDVARQVRELLLGMQGQTTEAETAAAGSADFTELMQRLEMTTSQANTAARSHELGLAVNNSTLATAPGTTAMAREALPLQAPAQSAFEAARQTQQAIDILGNGAPERLRERISVMFNTRTQAAEMRLDPPDLGRLTIRLNMNQEQASVSFQVSSPQAREALEQNFPRLRELLAEQGIQLADANVSEQQGQSRQQPGDEDPGRHADTGYEMGETHDEAEVIELQIPTAVATGRVDYFV